MLKLSSQFDTEPLRASAATPTCCSCCCCCIVSSITAAVVTSRGLARTVLVSQNPTPEQLQAARKEARKRRIIGALFPFAMLAGTVALLLLLLEFFYVLPVVGYIFDDDISLFLAPVLALVAFVAFVRHYKLSYQTASVIFLILTVGVALEIFVWLMFVFGF